MKTAKYFARYGKVYGPFQPDEVEDLHATGRIREYFWVWDEGQKAWLPMDPAPAPLVLKPVRDVPAPEAGKAAPVMPMPTMSADKLEVICHNKHQFMVGRLDFMTQTGCELFSADQASSPIFPDNAPVILNILQADSEQLLNIKARICGISRTRAGWTYQLRWDAPPDFAVKEG